MPSGAVSVGDRAFKGCTGLTVKDLIVWIKGNPKCDLNRKIAKVLYLLKVQ